MNSISMIRGARNSALARSNLADSREGIDLLDRARRRDAEAMARLYRIFYPQINRFCLARLHNEEVAADAASDVFEKMLRGLPSYRLTRVPFEAWLFRIARNTVIDVVRREKRRARLMDLRQTAIGGYDWSYERVAERAMIEQCLAGLTSTQRRVIEMRFIHGHDVRTVASAIGRSEQATKSIQFRALTSMRRSLAAGPQVNEALAA